MFLVLRGERWKSLQAQADNQRFQLEATYLALTANIVVAAVQEAGPCEDQILP